MPLYALPLDLGVATFSMLPKVVSLPNGDELVMKWYDAEEISDYSEYPYGTFGLLTQVYRDPIHRFDGTSLFGGDEVEDTITFNTGTMEYRLTRPDLHSLTSLEGTAGGSPRVFIFGVDFDIREADTYSTDSHVVWIEGGTLPDDGTQFLITYRPRLGRENRILETYVVYRLGIHCKDVPVSLVLGTTVPYTRSQLIQHICDYLLGYLALQRGRDFGPGPRRTFVFKGEYSQTYLPFDPGESVRRAFVDVYFQRRIYPVQLEHEFIGDIDPPAINPV